MMPAIKLGRAVKRSKKLQPIPVFLPGKSHGQRSLEGYRGWGHKESDTANQEHTQRAVKRVIKTPIKDTDDDVYKSGWKNAHISDHCFLVAQMVKNLPTIQETQVGSLGQEDPLEKKMVTHSSILAWRIPWTKESGGHCPWGHKESDMTELLTHIQTHTYTQTHMEAEYCPLTVFSKFH